MMTRSTTTAVAGRSSSMRRLRRRAHAYAGVADETRTYCRTNGCASFLEIDPASGVPTCPICGYVARTH